MKLWLLARIGIAALLSALCALPQSWISVGVKGGVPLTDPFADRTFNYVVTTIPNPFFGLPPTVITQANRTFSDSKLFVLGPTIEAQLPFGLAVEADALYRPMDLTVTQTTSFASFLLGSPTFSTRIESWEFPLLAKYRLPLPKLKPYVEAGPSFRATSGTFGNHMSGKGVSAGIGLEVRFGHLRFAPEVRYTHWGSDGPYTTPYHAVTNANQVEFLAGVSTVPSASGTAGRALSGWNKYLSLGVKGGLPFTNAFLTDQYAVATANPLRCGDFSNTACPVGNYSVQTYRASRNYLIGPMVEVHLPFRVSVEGDAMYGPLSPAPVSSSSIVGLAGLLLLPSIKTFDSWQFPVVAKYRFSMPFASPYLEAGPTFRTASTNVGHYLSQAGVTAGVGVEANIWRVHIAPEVRFVHWGNDAPDTPPFYASRRNQGQFLVGLSY